MDFTDFLHKINRGDTRKFRFQVVDSLTLVPQNIGAWTQFRYTAKLQLQDADGDAIIHKSLGAGVTVVDSASGLVEIQYNPADTSSLAAQDYSLYADVQGTDPSNGIWSAKGRAIIQPDVTIASP